MTETADPIRAYRLLGRHRYPLCGQDLHGTRHASPVGVELECRCANAAEIIACLQQGRYRMTNGVVSFGSELIEAIASGSERVSSNTTPCGEIRNLVAPTR
jgi:hypothetical protein